MAAQRRLHELDQDILGKILARPLLDPKSRIWAGAACTALWKASCLPGVWTDLDLSLDLADQDKTDSALLFLERRGAELQSVRLVTKCSTADQALPQQRLAGLLDRLPVLQELLLQSRDIGYVHLHELAASQPRLKELTLVEHWRGWRAEGADRIPLPLDHYTGLQDFSYLQRLVLLDVLNERPQKPRVTVGLLLRGIEALTELTELSLASSSPPQKWDPFLTHMVAWSDQLSRLEKLQAYRDDYGIMLPPEIGGLPSLRALRLRITSWEEQGGVLCALRGLTLLDVWSDLAVSEEYRVAGEYMSDEHTVYLGGWLPDPSGLKQALSTVEQLTWTGPVPGLEGYGEFCLDRLVRLELKHGSDLLRCLSWSPLCRLKELCLTTDENAEDYALGLGGDSDLLPLSPLTTLTSLVVNAGRVLSLPEAPCLAHLQELRLIAARVDGYGGYIPAELQGAEGLQLLAISDQPGLVVDRDCAAMLAGLSELKEVRLQKCRKWDRRRGDWDEQSAERFAQICSVVDCEGDSDSDDADDFHNNGW